jgi:hypothetical protein
MRPGSEYFADCTFRISTPVRFGFTSHLPRGFLDIAPEASPGKSVNLCGRLEEEISQFQNATKL